MHDIESLKQKMQSLGISFAKKALGQNFLVSTHTIEKIVAAALSFPNKSFIEVGPGLGALTDHLAKDGRPLLLIELDKTFIEYWKGKGFSVIAEDALRADWSTFAVEKPVAFVSNLPYQISSSIVIERSIYPCSVAYMVLMFQKEVAERIQARHSTEAYGFLSVIAQTFWKVAIVTDAGPKDFYPPPKVASRVLKFEYKDLPIWNAEKREKFLKFVKASFHQRRKFLMNNLKSLPLEKNSLELVEQELIKMGLDAKVRAENLSIENYSELFHRVIDSAFIVSQRSR